MTEKVALGRQEGGAHYLRRKIQTVEFWAANGWDSFAGSTLKYLDRWEEKGGLLDLRKALHYSELRFELGATFPPRPVSADRKISMNRYIKANGIPADQDPLFYALEAWVELGSRPEGRKAYRTFVELLRDFIEDQEIKSTKCGDSK